jgi:diaminopropionate ammonia-lyase
MDAEARASVEELKRWGVEAGPCGAAPLAALRKFDKDVLGEGALVVLICTEGRQ